MFGLCKQGSAHHSGDNGAALDARSRHLEGTTGQSSICAGDQSILSKARQKGRCTNAEKQIVRCTCQTIGEGRREKCRLASDVGRRNCQERDQWEKDALGGCLWDGIRGEDLLPILMCAVCPSLQTAVNFCAREYGTKSVSTYDVLFCVVKHTPAIWCASWVRTVYMTHIVPVFRFQYESE